MFYLLSPTKIISVVAASYAALLLLLSLIWKEADFLIALKGATLLEILLLVFGLWAWRKLWAKFPALNKWFFPDLNGEWRATIKWVKGEESGEAEGVVRIKQDFFKISIEVDSDNSGSETQAVFAKLDAESGRPMLHYIYTVHPKQVAPDVSPTYQGAALLKVDHRDINRLEGNYFTSRATKGHFSFVRVAE